MRLLAILLALLVILPSAPVDGAPAGQNAGPATLHLKNGLWFDGSAFRREDWYSVDGRLTRIPPARVDAAIDLAGRYVLPPFAEAHNHDLQNAWMGAQFSPRYLRQGIFYSLQMCADPQGAAAVRSLLDQAANVDVLFAEACISASDGHPLGIALAMDRAAGQVTSPDDIRDRLYLAVDTVAELDERWPTILASRTSVVKLILVNSEDYEANRSRPELFGFNGLDPALVPEVVDRAHAAGMRVVAHVDTAADFATAVSGGVDIIAHLPGYRFTPDKQAGDYRIADAVISDAARRGITVVTTAVAARRNMERRPEVAQAIRDTQIDNLRRLLQGGVRLAIGSDLVGEGSVLDEIAWLDGLGVMPRAQLLRIATMETPRLIFPGRAIGRFQEGTEASLIVLDGDPLADLAATRRVWMRVKHGNILDPVPSPAA